MSREIVVSDIVAQQAGGAVLRLARRGPFPHLALLVRVSDGLRPNLTPFGFRPAWPRAPPMWRDVVDKASICLRALVARAKP